MQRLQFTGITKSKNPMKKWDATFILPPRVLGLSETLPTGRTKVVSFGAAGMTDFTLSPRRSPEERREAIKRRRLYINRHRERENWRNPLTAGALSRWILWEKESLEDALKAFRERFGL